MGSVTLLPPHCQRDQRQANAFAKLLTVTTSGCTDHCKMGNAGSVDNGGQVELRQDMKDEANQLKEEYDQLREGKERLSITHLRKSLKRQQSTDKKTLSEEEDKLKQMFSNKKDLNFQDFLKWKMQSVLKIDIDPNSCFISDTFRIQASPQWPR